MAIEARKVVGDRAPVVVDGRPAIEACIEGQEIVEIVLVRERGVRIPVHADDLGRDTLADLRLMARLGQHHEAGVAVEIDEAGRHHVAGRVDHACSVDVGHDGVQIVGACPWRS